MIEFYHNISVKDYNDLRRAVGWNEVDYAKACAGLENTTFIVRAVCKNENIGMGRLITAREYIALIVDVAVRPEFQRRGVGKAIMENMLAYIKGGVKDGQTVYVHLLASKDKEGFYEQFGFAERPQAYMGSWKSKHIYTKPIRKMHVDTCNKTGFIWRAY